MVLTNIAIVDGLKRGAFAIDGIAGMDPSQSPFNTSAVDLRIAPEIRIPSSDMPVQLDLRRPGIAKFLLAHSKKIEITEEQPFILTRNRFILAITQERVSFPITDGQCYSARVEGKSSLARCGILVHFTAPTIHAGFKGPIALEMINFGPLDFTLSLGLFVCQLIIEEVRGNPVDAPNQFSGQTTPAGV